MEFKGDTKTDYWGLRSLLEEFLVPWMDRQRGNSMVGTLRRVQILALGTESMAKALKRGPCDRSGWERFHSIRLHPDSLVYR